MEDGLEEAKTWIEDFEENFLSDKDRVIWFSGISEEAHQLLVKCLAEKLYHLHLSYAYEDL
jgi:hypothetical protein